jgi:ferredoxin, 2Fe-2S
MPRVIIYNLFEKTLERVDSYRPVLQQLHEHDIDWMHACGGKGRCTTCKFKVLKGQEQIAPCTPAEVRFQKAGELKSDERLACQAIIQGDIIIMVPDEYKLPHLRYSD